MMYIDAQYLPGGQGDQVVIKVVISGLTTFVPCDPSNADYRAIHAEVAAGRLTIAPAPPPK